MSLYREAIPDYEKPDFEYGNRSPIEVIRIVPNIGMTALDPHASLEHDTDLAPPFTEVELREKVTEIANSYKIIGDPKSTEANPKQFGIAVANGHLLELGVPAVVMMSTSGSSLYNAEGKPNNEGNAIELAYMAFKHPEKPIVYVESPGNGNSTDLTTEEYQLATQDGKLVHEVRYNSGKIAGYESFGTLEALARALDNEGISVSHLSSNAGGAHFSTALLAALPENSVERAFLYNPTNISDRNVVALTLGNLKEIITQGKYAKSSKDPLQLTDERKKMAQEVMSAIPKRKIDLIRGATHNPAKLSRQQKIFRHGNANGQAAAVQSVIGQVRHADLRQTFVFPEFASHYKDPGDFVDFMQIIGKLGGQVIELTDLESLKIPMGQYGHSHFPTVRATLEGYAFNR